MSCYASVLTARGKENEIGVSGLLGDDSGDSELFGLDLAFSAFDLVADVVHLADGVDWTLSSTTAEAVSPSRQAA